MSRELNFSIPCKQRGDTAELGEKLVLKSSFTAHSKHNQSSYPVRGCARGTWFSQATRQAACFASFPSWLKDPFRSRRSVCASAKYIISDALKYLPALFSLSDTAVTGVT